jgi:hypothetical protein
MGILVGSGCQHMYDSGETLSEPSIEVAEFNEGSHTMWSLGYWPSFYGSDFASVHIQASRVTSIPRYSVVVL